MAGRTLCLAVQDYAKAIYALESREGAAVTMNRLADRLGVRSASASGMVKKLAELGLVDHAPYRSVQLTPPGERLALEVLRRHRLLELFLAKLLDWSHSNPAPGARSCACWIPTRRCCATSPPGGSPPAAT